MTEGGHIRALRILETLAGLQQPAPLMTIAEHAGLPKTKAYRVLRDLQDNGYVDHIGRSGYRVGARAIALASLVGPRPALVQRALPVLVRLAIDAGETASLHLRSGAHRVLVLRADPPGSTHRIAAIGERSPLTSGCGGTAILAYLPTPEVDIVLGRESRVVRLDLPDHLAQIRRQGYATSQSANHPELNGIAAPLLDPDSGHALGSIAIAGAPSRLPDPGRLARPLLAACAELGPRLATVLGPSSSVRLESLDVTIQNVLQSQA
ncbi:helix-turn-helix domain-containing protein [Pseudonocardia ailaonensis]|uniref:Helix-turn-helix domain-containing protein n=1 Tax=Pseudonocardia ailaonensis TaxID=367279 RepID=A0ABN2N7R0_9PSEU